MTGLHVIQAEAFPSKPDSPDRGLGAFINVYVTEPSREAALAKAHAEIDEAGWSIASIESVDWITRDAYDEDPSGVEYFDQALIDGVVVVIHKYRTD